jgi:hypothetical protein
MTTPTPKAVRIESNTTRPWWRWPLCLMRVCGGRIYDDELGLWWQCETCAHYSHKIPWGFSNQRKINP